MELGLQKQLTLQLLVHLVIVLIAGLRSGGGAWAESCSIPDNLIAQDSPSESLNVPDRQMLASGIYFYTNYFSDWAHCNGTVTGYEYCYLKANHTGNALFTLLVLEEDDEQNYTVIFVGRPKLSEEQQECNNASYCCDTKTLQEGDWFHTGPSLRHAIIVPERAVSGTSLLYAYSTSTGYIPASPDLDGVSRDDILTREQLINGASLTNVTERIFQFIVSTSNSSCEGSGNDDDSTSAMSASSSSSPTPTRGIPGMSSEVGPTRTRSRNPSSSSEAPTTQSSSRVVPTTQSPGPVGDGGGGDASGSDSSIVAIAVAVSLLVFIALAVVGSALVGVFIWRKKRKDAQYQYSPSDHVQEDLRLGIHNATYLGRDVTESAEHVYEQEDEFGPGGEEQHDYAMPDGRAAELDVRSYSVAGPLDYLVPVSSIGSTAQQPSMARVSDNEIYTVPESDEHSLYAQLRRFNVKSIPREDVKLNEEIGSGQFGIVSKGVWQSPDGPVEVAVKTLKSRSSQDDKVKFLQEAAIMGQFPNHYNVVKLYGVVITGEPKMMIIELLSLGDLRKHLQSLKPQGQQVDNNLPHVLLSYCRQIASGMSYLAAKGFVHRDLAARNILLTEDGTCKIADFGMARDLQDDDYYKSRGGKIPVKWTAPEALNYKKFSPASDVWSYGILMYEIWSLGHKPYEQSTNPEVVIKINSGFRLPPPPGTPEAIYDVMIKCWHPEVNQRPTFPILVQWLFRPDSKLLKWPEEKEESEDAEARILGAELKAGTNLYTKLQNQYMQ